MANSTLPIQDLIPLSRITLIYRTTIDGQTAPVELPFRQLILGAFSLGTKQDDEGDLLAQGTSKDLQTFLEDRMIRSVTPDNFFDVMKDMEIRLSLYTVADQITGSPAPIQAYNLPIDHINAFDPYTVAQNVPQVWRLVQMKQLLQQLKSFLNSNPDVYKSLQGYFNTFNQVVAFRTGGFYGVFDLTKATLKEMISTQTAPDGTLTPILDSVLTAMGFRKTDPTWRSPSYKTVNGPFSEAAGSIALAGSYSATVAVPTDATDNTLNGVVTAINNAKLGITAAATNNVLQLTGTKSDAQTVQFTVQGPADVKFGAPQLTDSGWVCVSQTTFADPATTPFSEVAGAALSFQITDTRTVTVAANAKLTDVSAAVAALKWYVKGDAPQDTSTNTYSVTIAVDPSTTPPADFNLEVTSYIPKVSFTAPYIPTPYLSISTNTGTDVDGKTSITWYGVEVLSGDVQDADLYLSGLATLLYNLPYTVPNHGTVLSKQSIDTLSDAIDGFISSQVDAVLHHPGFQAVESAWRGLFNLVSNTAFSANITISILDVTQDELAQDFADNIDITGTALFPKVYTAEYDQYGGQPYGVMIGLYEFGAGPQDIAWLEQMAKLANACHAPFIASVSYEYFGCKDIDELRQIRDFDVLFTKPSYFQWNDDLRQRRESPYLGLTFPRFLLRSPWDKDNNPSQLAGYTEWVQPDDDSLTNPKQDPDHDKFLWGSAAWLFARNLNASFASSGWCQYLRGVKGGGLITGLPIYTYNVRGYDEYLPPVELVIPDYRELELSNGGLIPLIYEKNSANATFFGSQSVMQPTTYVDPMDSMNSQLIANLSYTFSITRIAHYIKSIMRDNIGSSADATYIQDQLQAWLNGYVTKVTNPDILTLRYYPFKAATVTVTPRTGEIGWYDSVVSVLPHLQFEGMEVELRLEARLG